MVSRLIYLLGCILSCCFITTATFSQEEFVQFTFFDQLVWSENGNQLAFRCILLDEARPDQLKSNILVKDLANDRIVCLDPFPERFAISQDKKYLLFSSSYGLYLMSLKSQSRTTQIYFRNPAANWWLQDFGFLKKKSSIYVDRYDHGSGEVIREYYQLPVTKATDPAIEWAELKQIKKIRSSSFNLTVDELRGNQLPEVQLKNALLKFLPQSGPGEYQLVYQSDSPKSAAEILIKDSRPRLLSANPAKTEMIVSVFQSESHWTYRFSMNLRKLIPIENKRYFSISWLDDSRYICITEDGLWLRSFDLTINEQLSHWRLPQWCHSIDRSLPQYELQMGFEPDKKIAEQLTAKLLKLGYFARIKYFKDQLKEGYRIRLGGFADRKAAQAEGQELKKKGFDYWIDQIADLYDYFNARRNDERSSFDKDNKAIIEYKFDNYLRSRIILQTPARKTRIVVDEMNNIPERSPW